MTNHNGAGFGVFASEALKLWELGYNVIPVQGKRPVVNGWTKWSRDRQSEQEVELMVKAHGHFGIGLVCGLTCTAVDIDADCKELLGVIPSTPMIRRGKRGWGALYRGSASDSKKGRLYPLDIQRVGTQVVIPPSIHPDTEAPYAWLEGSELVKASDLPEFTEADLGRLEAACDRLGVLKAGGLGKQGAAMEGTGRNNRMTEIAFAIAADAIRMGLSDKLGIEKLMDADIREHGERPMFKDREHLKSRGFATSYEYAEDMYSRAKAKHVKEGIKVWPKIELNIGSSKSAQEYQSEEWRSLIPKGGLIERAIAVMDEIQTPFDIDAIKFGAAISLCATLACNRLQFMGTWPNMYVLTLAPSGIGKGGPQSVINQALNQSICRGSLLGAGGYKSANSILKNLTVKRERIDVVDECSEYFTSMSDKKNLQFAHMAEVMCKLWSNSNQQSPRIEAMGKEKEVPAVWNACVNWLGSTTPAAIRNAMTPDVFEKGMGARILWMYQGYGKGEPRDFVYSNAVFKSDKFNTLLLAINEILAIEKPMIKGPAYAEAGTQYDPIDLGAGPEVMGYLQLLGKSTSREVRGIESESAVIAAILNRKVEIIRKLVVIYCLSQGERVVTVDILDWAKAVWSLSYLGLETAFEMKIGTSTRASRLEDAVNKLAEETMGMGFYGITSGDLRRRMAYIYGSDTWSYDKDLTNVCKSQGYELLEIRNKRGQRMGILTFTNPEVDKSMEWNGIRPLRYKG